MSATTTVAKKLARCIKTPSGIASALDWKRVSGGSILSLDIRRDRIALAVGLHPSFGEAPRNLMPIPIKHENNKKRKVICNEAIDELHYIVREHQVCAMLVSWPVEKEGWQGAPCGRVLHTLDSLVEKSSLINPNRPFCLWDIEHVALGKEDKWGRCPVRGHTCSEPAIRIAGEEQYGEEHQRSIAIDLWKDFSKTHWPEFAQGADELLGRKQTSRATGHRPAPHWHPDLDDTGEQVNVAASI